MLCAGVAGIVAAVGGKSTTVRPAFVVAGMVRFRRHAFIPQHSAMATLRKPLSDSRGRESSCAAGGEPMNGGALTPETKAKSIIINKFKKNEK
jgi:hypothetical protein